MLCLSCGSQLQMSNQRPTDATSSTKEGRTSAPVVMSAADLSAKESRTLAPCIKNEKMSSYRSWLQERQLLRKGLDNFVVLEDWLAGKAEKTDLERRVLQQIVEENYLKNLRPAVCCAFSKAYLCFNIVMALICCIGRLILLCLFYISH